MLTLNAGSSSIKFALFDASGPPTRAAVSGQVQGIGAGLSATLQVRDDGGAVLTERELGGAEDHDGALAAVLRWLESQGDFGRVLAVGHRVVHGGTAFDRPMRVDAALLDALDALASLAPLHQPHNLAGVRAALRAFGDVGQVACFDTAFHRTQASVQQHFALPIAWFDKGLRRYGFHGLSYESIAVQLGDRREGKVVVAHLGNGASLCAMQGGRSVATTMSFSPLDGLTMGSRCGHLDAAVVLHLQREHGLSLDDVSQVLHRESGLLGLSGLSSDLRVLEASTGERARLAIAHFEEQLLQGIAAMAAALRGIDTLVFTAGIGENAVALRARVVRALAWLGLELDEAANSAGGPRITTSSSRVEALVLRTDEEAVIAAHTAKLLGLGLDASRSLR